MNYFAEGSETTELQEEDVSTLLDTMLEQCGRLDRVLLLPPDITRLHSGAGEITVMLYERLRERAHIEIMPALGTHVPMSESEARRMFPGIPFEVFRPHNCRKDIAHLGEVPRSSSAMSHRAECLPRSRAASIVSLSKDGGIASSPSGSSSPMK